METKNNVLQQLGLMGYLFRWIDEHPRTSNILLWLMGLALAWFAFNYDFTTRI